MKDKLISSISFWSALAVLIPAMTACGHSTKTNPAPAPAKVSPAAAPGTTAATGGAAAPGTTATTGGAAAPGTTATTGGAPSAASAPSPDSAVPIPGTIEKPAPSAPAADPSQSPDSAGYKTCVNADPNHYCMGLKIVAFEENGAPTLTKAQAVKLVKEINAVWSQCNIGFQLESYSSVDPSTKGLPENPDWRRDSSNIRSTFSSDHQFVVISVGSFSEATIAVTEMPGGGPYGALVEAAYATNAYTVGHELGHYQNLDHVKDETNVMNPFIGPETNTLTTDQCATARSADQDYWKAMMRN